MIQVRLAHYRGHESGRSRKAEKEARNGVVQRDGGF